MKKTLILIIFIFKISSSYSQDFTYSFIQCPQIAYLGSPNTLSCTVEGLSCKTIMLSTDNGEITKISCDKYAYKPSKVADTKIIISRKATKGFIKVGEFYIAVRDIPDPIARVGGLSGGYISKGALNAQGGIRADSPPFLAIYVNYMVKSFGALITKNGQLVFHHSYNDNSFSPDIHEAFKLLQKEDRVVFSSIAVEFSDEKKGLAKPIEFIISN